MLDNIIQILIVVSSCLAVWLVNKEDKKWSKWGSLSGMIGQPLWLYTTYIAEQWGLFTISVFYLYCWGQGVYNNFIKSRHGC